MNQATTPQATKNETTKPTARTIHSRPFSAPTPPCLRNFSRSYNVAAAIVGLERKKENSKAASRDIPAICPPAMVDIERDVPGKTAERIWQAPIQMAWPSDIPSMCATRE